VSTEALVGPYEIKQGATWVVEFQYVDQDGAAIDLTGYTARMQGRTDYEASSTIFSLTSPSGGLVIDGPMGLVTATLTAVQTAAMTKGAFVYDVEIVSAGGVVTRLAEGHGVISREVTR
jgi:hypothetical protein